MTQEVTASLSLFPKATGGEPESTAKRLLKHVEWQGPCLVWMAYSRNGRYGDTRRNKRWVKVHRVAYELAYGPITPGNVVMHLCDNPRCVNPKHLTQGSQGDNVRDAQRKGRMMSADGGFELPEGEEQAFRAGFRAGIALAGRTDAGGLDEWFAVQAWRARLEE